MNPLLHILRVIWQARTGSFLHVYAIISGVTAIGVAWAVWPTTTQQRGSKKAGTAPTLKDVASGVGIVALAMVGVILVGYVVLAMKWEAFADYDEAWYTLYSLRGINFGSPIWPASGRFSRLAIRSSI